MSAMTKKEAWSEPQFECPRCGHCCPPQPEREWVGLTLKEVLINRHLIDWTSEWSYLEFARAVEQALKEKNT